MGFRFDEASVASSNGGEELLQNDTEHGQLFDGASSESEVEPQQTERPYDELLQLLRPSSEIKRPALKKRKLKHKSGGTIEENRMSLVSQDGPEELDAPVSEEDVDGDDDSGHSDNDEEVNGNEEDDGLFLDFICLKGRSCVY